MFHLNRYEFEDEVSEKFRFYRWLSKGHVVSRMQLSFTFTAFRAFCFTLVVGDHALRLASRRISSCVVVHKKSSKNFFDQSYIIYDTVHCEANSDNLVTTHSEIVSRNFLLSVFRFIDTNSLFGFIEPNESRTPRETSYTYDCQYFFALIAFPLELI